MEITYHKRKYPELCSANLDGDKPLFSTLPVHSKPIFVALERLQVQRNVLRQDVCGDEPDYLLVRTGQVRAGLVDEPLLTAHTVLALLVLQECGV